MTVAEQERRTDDQRVIVRMRKAGCATFQNPNFRWSRLVSRYRGVVTKQTTVRLPDDLADEAEAVARVKGTSVNALIVESLATEIERVRADKNFTKRARKLLERDKELLDRLAR